jgi:hypothetical protein
VEATFRHLPRQQGCRRAGGFQLGVSRRSVLLNLFNSLACLCDCTAPNSWPLQAAMGILSGVAVFLLIERPVTRWLTRLAQTSVASHRVVPEPSAQAGTRHLRRGIFLVPSCNLPTLFPARFSGKILTSKELKALFFHLIIAAAAWCCAKAIDGLRPSTQRRSRRRGGSCTVPH